MPRFDRTGPKGMGPNTGRGKGKCNLDRKNLNDKSMNLETEKKEFDLRSNTLGEGKRSNQGRNNR